MFHGDCEARLCLRSLSRLGLVLLLLQYSTEFLFHTARLCHFADENNEKLFNAWAAVFGVTRLFILTLAVLAIGFGLARMENQAFDPEKGNFNTLLCRLPRKWGGESREWNLHTD